METKSFQELFDAMKNYIIAHSGGKISDWNEGSVIRSFVEAVAREGFSFETRAQLGFFDMIKSLPYNAFDFEKKKGAKASGGVIFGREKPMPYRTEIPANTAVSSGGLLFYTVEAGYIESGETASPLVPVSAAEIGEKYNVKPLMIDTIASALPEDVKTVQNPASLSGGADVESQSDFLIRFSEYIKGLGKTNYYGIKSEFERQPYVRSCSMIAHIPPKDGVYHGTIYVEDGSGGLTEDEEAAANLLLYGDGTAEHPGLQPFGMRYHLTAPEAVPVNLTVRIWSTNDAYKNMDLTAVQVDVADFVETFLNAFPIGRDFYAADLIKELKRQKDYVLSVAVESGQMDDKMTIRAAENQILRFGSVEVVPAVINAARI